MKHTLFLFFNMGGYALNVWGAYLSVLIFLFLQWFIAWRRFRKTYKGSANKHEQ